MEEWGERPLLLALDADARQLGRIETELQRAFGADFRVRGELRWDDGVRTLQGAHDRNESVALVLVDDRFTEEQRSQVFATARTLHPDARRALLVPWGAWAEQESARTILHGIAVGDFSYYVLKPWTARDEFFRRTVAEFVHEWSRSELSNLREVVVIATQHSGRAYAVTDLLGRNGIPHAFRDRASKLGQQALDYIGHPEGEVVVWMAATGGPILVDPTDAEILQAWGLPTDVGRRRPRCRSVAGGRWSRRTGVRGVCGVRGRPHASGRAGGHWRPGRRQLADSELPGLRTGREWCRTDPAGISAGLGIRRSVPAYPAGGPAQPLIGWLSREHL